jgi:hypothetical protein
MNVLPLHFIVGIFILGMILVFGVLMYLEKSGWMFSQSPNRADDLFKDKQVLTGSYNGRKYQYVYDCGYGEGLTSHQKRHSAPFFEVTAECLSKGDFRIVKESWIDILLKMMGMFREIQTGDADFDKKFYIETNTPHLASAFLKEVRTREIVEQIFQTGFTELEQDGSVMKAKWKHFVITGDFDPSFVEKTGKAIVSLAGAVPETFEVTAEPRISHLRIQRKVTFALSYLLAIIGYFLFSYGGALYPPLEEGMVWGSFTYSLPLFILFMGYVIFLFKGSASSYRVLFTFLGFSLAGFVLSGMGLATVINGAADSGKMSVYTVKVIEKSEAGSRPKNYYVHVESWRSDMKRTKIRIPFETYREVQPYQTRFNIYTKPGRLGFEWLAGWEVYQPKNRWDV